MVDVDLNAVTRSLDLACKIISPAVVGLVMTYASTEHSAVVIAAWNIFSLVAEYLILSHIYRLVPALSVKQTVLSGEFPSVSYVHYVCCTDSTLICYVNSYYISYIEKLESQVTGHLQKRNVRKLILELHDISTLY